MVPVDVKVTDISISHNLLYFVVFCYWPFLREKSNAFSLM
jgi:hypothetical protein